MAAEIGAFHEVMEGYLPDIVVGDTEGLLLEMPPNLYTDRLATFEEVTGEPLPFFHLDVDWGRTDWPTAAAALGANLTAAGTEFGLFYIGNLSDDSDRAWVELAGERAGAFEEARRECLPPRWGDRLCRSPRPQS